MRWAVCAFVFFAACTCHAPDPQRARYVAAMHAARGWLDGLMVDPAELRAHGIKGKKKLAEQLDAYRRLWRVAGDTEKAALKARAQAVGAVVRAPGYHDLADVGADQLKQDATSYLRVAVLLEQLGVDTTEYRAEIRKIQPRLDAQMERRGPHQQRVFHTYYGHFGLTEPFPLADALQKGVIAQRVDPVALTLSQSYELTHEVYALYDYGDRLDIDPFDASEKAYLRLTLTAMATHLIRDRNFDLLGEVVECLHYLRLEKEPAYAAGVQALLDGQNADGSWGRYPDGPYVKQGFALHTTLTAIAALTSVFDRPMPAVPTP